MVEVSGYIILMKNGKRFTYRLSSDPQIQRTVLLDVLGFAIKNSLKDGDDLHGLCQRCALELELGVEKLKEDDAPKADAHELPNEHQKAARQKTNNPAYIIFEETGDCLASCELYGPSNKLYELICFGIAQAMIRLHGGKVSVRNILTFTQNVEAAISFLSGQGATPDLPDELPYDWGGVTK